VPRDGDVKPAVKVFIQNLWKNWCHEDRSINQKLHLTKLMVLWRYRKLERRLGIGVVQIKGYEIRKPTLGAHSAYLIDNETGNKEFLYESNLNRVLQRKKSLEKL